MNLSRLAAVILESSGKYDVMVVNQSHRAIAAALQFQAEALLLDVDMPGLSGGDLALEAARDSRLRDVPILFLTGLLSHAETGHGSIKSGGKQFLAKPVNPEELLASMDSLLPRTVLC